LDAKALEVMARLNKKHGPGTSFVGSEAKTYSRFPSGSLGLDLILGGGWAANQWHEIFGEASAGKTNLAYATIAANQRKDPEFTTVFIAAEEYVKGWAQAAGVDTDRLIVVETCIMEDAYEAALDFASSRGVDCVVIDSLPMLVPGAEDEKEMDGNTVGAGARLTGKFFRKVGKASKRSMTEDDRPFLGIMLNQYRMKIGVMYGDPRTTPGGGAKDYAYFSRVEVARDEWIEAGVGKDKDRIGQVVRGTTKKNKSAPPGQQAYYDLYFDKGGPVAPGQIDYVKEIVTLGILYEIIDKSGSWYQYGDIREQGKDAFSAAVRDDAEASAQIEREVLQVLRVVA
jgi:recombination protein RecA